MFSRLEEKHYGEVKEQHRGLIAQFPLINAVISKLQNGSVYADPATDSFFISTKAGFSLYDSAEPIGTFDYKLFDVLKRCYDIPNYIHIYSPTRSLADYFEKHSEQCRIRRRAQFRRHDATITQNYESFLPPGDRIATIQEVGFDQLEEAFKLDLGRRYWNSRKEFLRRAIGTCILNGENEPLAICYSACVVDGVAEMDTLVLPEYRGKRFMRIVSEPFFNLAAANTIIPHWDTFISNKASYTMAQKFGLQLLQEYDLLSLALR